MRDFILFLLIGGSVAPAQVAFNSPASVPAGAEFTVPYSGSAADKDYLSISEKGSADSRYLVYVYFSKGNPLPMRAPDEPGDYELRHMSADNRLISRKAVTVTPVSAEVSAPASVEAGAEFQVNWKGPNNPRDFVTIVPKGTPESQYEKYFYTDRGNPGTLRAPDASGEYEVRYLTGQKYLTLAVAPITIGGAEASLQAPAQVAAGAPVEIRWAGPNNNQDFISIVPEGTPERQYKAYVYTDRGNPAKLQAPEQPGRYEIRYLTGQTYATLATAPLIVGDVTASVTPPARAVGGEPFAVSWTGPDNHQDFITIVKAGAPAGTWEHYRYTQRGSPLDLIAPLEAGEYEVRYLMGRSHRTLASAPIRIGPPTTAPGKLRVVSQSSTAGGVDASAGGAVQIILDASGSMLQRMGSERRIEIAKRTLAKLTSEAIPPGAPFALRVFGHKEADSCRSDLEIPLAPLDPAKARLKISEINAVNLAKTPIADSLTQVLADLRGAKTGQRLIVLITDGEETCGGDPAAAIEALRAAGVDVRVNIVGFAIDDEALEETFRYWADLGDGGYHSASDAAGLDAAVSEAMRTPFEVLDGEGRVVAAGLLGGAAVDLPAGSYAVRTKTAAPKTVQGVIVEPGRTAVAEIP